MLNDVEEAKENEGLDVMSGQIVQLFEKGIIDPAKVTRSALQNAASVALMVLTTDALVAEIKEKESPSRGGMPPMPEDY